MYIGHPDGWPQNGKVGGTICAAEACSGPDMQLVVVARCRHGLTLKAGLPYPKPQILLLKYWTFDM